MHKYLLASAFASLIIVTTSKLINDCFNETSFLPDEDDSSRYWKCNNGVLTLESCPIDHYFHKDSQSCIFSNYIAHKALHCPPDVVDFLPYTGDCSKYIWCYYGTSYLMSCDKELWFSSSEKRCVYPEMSDCEDNLPLSTPNVNVHCSDVSSSDIILKECTCGCRFYWECRGKKTTLKRCENNLNFIEEKQLCAISEDCRSDVTPYPWTSTFPTTREVTGPGYDDPRCDDRNDIFLPHPDCTKFTQCILGQGYVRNCPKGLYFDAFHEKCAPNTNYCDFKTMSTVFPPETTTITSTETTTITSTWSIYPPSTAFWCSGLNGVEFTYYAGNCSLYVECYHGTGYIMKCPDNLWFDDYVGACVPSTVSNCPWR